MAKRQHPLEMAIQRFDDTVKMYFNQINQSFKGLDEFNPPKQKARKIAAIETPFRDNREIM